MPSLGTTALSIKGQGKGLLVVAGGAEGGPLCFPRGRLQSMEVTYKNNPFNSSKWLLINRKHQSLCLQAALPERAL